MYQLADFLVLDKDKNGINFPSKTSNDLLFLKPVALPSAV